MAANPKVSRDIGRHPGRAWRFLKRLTLTVVALGVIGLMMHRLVNVSHPKVAPQAHESYAAVPVGATPLVAVRKVTVLDSEVASGKITPVHESEVASQIMEKVVELNVKAGQKVKKGDVLARLDDTVLKSRLQQAQANLAAAAASRDEAKKERDRSSQLVDRGVISGSDFDHAETLSKTAEANWRAAERAVHEAEATLQFCTISAPMDGVVIDKRIEAGDMAKPGQILVTLYDAMQIVANVRETLVGRLKEGQKVDVQIDRLNATCQGTVSEIIPEGDPVARTFPVKVVGQCRPGISKGMYAKLLIPLDPQELLVIPQSAVLRVGQLDMVEVSDGKHLWRRAIQLGRDLTVDKRAVVQVISGLDEGEQVADHPSAEPAVKAERAAANG